MQMTHQEMQDLITLAKTVQSMPDSDPRKAKRIEQLTEATKLYDEPIETIKPDQFLGNLLGYVGGVGKAAYGEGLLEAKKQIGLGGEGGRLQNVANAINPLEGSPSLESYMQRGGLGEMGHPLSGTRVGEYFNPSTRAILGFAGDMGIAGAGGIVGKSAAEAKLLQYAKNQGLLGTAANGVKFGARALLNPGEAVGKSLMRSYLSDADKAAAARGAGSVSELALNENIPGNSAHALTQNLNKVLATAGDDIKTNMAKAAIEWQAKNPGEPMPAATIQQVYGDTLDRLEKLKQIPNYTFAAEEAQNQLKAELTNSIKNSPQGASLISNFEEAKAQGGTPIKMAGPNPGEEYNAYLPGRPPVIQEKQVSTGIKPRTITTTIDPGEIATHPIQEGDLVDYARNGNNASFNMTPEGLRQEAIGRGASARSMNAYKVNPNTQSFDPTGLKASVQADLQESARNAEKNVMTKLSPELGANTAENYAKQHTILSGRDYVGKSFGPQENVSGFKLVPPVPGRGYVGALLDAASSAKLPLAQAARSPWTQMVGLPAINAATRKDPAEMSPEETLQYYLRSNQ